MARSVYEQARREIALANRAKASFQEQAGGHAEMRRRGSKRFQGKACVRRAAEGLQHAQARWFPKTPLVVVQRFKVQELAVGVEIVHSDVMIATSYRYVVQRAGIRSGYPIVEGTRIGVHDVVAMIKTGASVDEVVSSFPRLTRAQVYECLAYYEDHRAELDPLVATQTTHLNG